MAVLEAEDRHFLPLDRSTVLIGAPLDDRSALASSLDGARNPQRKRAASDGNATFEHVHHHIGPTKVPYMIPDDRLVPTHIACQPVAQRVWIVCLSRFVKGVN